MSSLQSTGVEGADWLQMFMGYCLTGHTMEEVLCVWHGPDLKRKNLLTSALRAASGEHCVDVSNVQNDRLVMGEALKEVVELGGKRLAICDHSGKGRLRLTGAYIKKVTDNTHVRQCHKFLLVTDVKPTFVDVEVDTLRRVSLVPFRDHGIASAVDIKDIILSRQRERAVVKWCTEGIQKWFAQMEAHKSALVPVPRVMSAVGHVL